MNPPIKKLAVLFLIISILTSSLALGLSALLNKSPGTVADLPAESARAAPNYKIYGAGQNGQNLTEEVTTLFARQLVAANPAGPQINPDGSVRLLSPTSTELFSFLAANPPSEDILKRPVDESKIQVIQDFEVDDISRYLSEVTQIQSALTSKPIWQANLATTTIDAAEAASWAPEARDALAAARDDMYKLKVPAPFVPMQKSLLAFFTTAASFSEIAIQDPVAAMALSSNVDLIIAGQADDLSKAAQDLQVALPQIISSLPPEEGSMLAEIFQAKVAQAFLGFGDIVMDPTLIATTISNWAKEFWLDYSDQIKSYAFGFLKNKLIQMVQQKIVEVARGAGAPAYVTNWLVYELDAGLSAKFGLISRRQAKLCGNAATAGLYGDVLASALGVPTYDAGVTGVEDTIGDMPYCPPISSGFYEDWTYEAEDFLQAVQYNVFSDLIYLKEEGMRAAGAASQAAIHEGLSGRGSLDIKKCDDGTPVDHEGLCGDGSYAQVITPGSAIQDILSKSVGSALDVISAANNQDTYSAIIQVLENALLSYLWKEGEGLFKNSSNSGGANRPPPASTASFESQLAWYEGQLETALNKTESAISKYTQAVGILQGSREVCGEDAADSIQQLVTGFNAAVGEFTAEADRIEGLLETVREFQANPGVHTQSELNSRVGTTAAITDLVTQADTDNSNAETDTEDAIALFQSCPAP